MVFGWKKKQSETRFSAPVHRDITLLEIGPMLEKLIKTRRESLVNNHHSSLKSVRNGLKEMRDITTTLEKEKLTEDETDKHISTIVERGKNQVITVIKKATASDIQKITEYNDVILANRELHKTLKLIGDVLGRQTRIIHIFAKKYASRLKRILSDLNITKDELTKLLSDHESFENTIKKINEMITRIQILHSNIEKLTLRQDTIKNEIKAHKDTCTDCNLEISKISATPEYAEYQKITQSINDLTIKRNVLYHDINESFAKISRPISKYVYVTSLDKEAKNTMHAILDNSARALFKSDAKKIIAILEHVKKAVLSETVSVKDIAKSGEQIDTITSEIPTYYSQIDHLEKIKTDLESEQASFDSAMLELANTKLDNAKSSIETLELRTHEIQTDNTHTKTEIPLIMEKIETQLRSITSIMYTVTSK